MNYLNIKYFPANISFYSFVILINLFFVLIFTVNIFWITTEQNREFKNSKILLIIPKNLDETEEKRDLIFNQLSLENQIISVELEDNKKVKILLEKILEDTAINDEIIPEVYNLIVKNKKKINLENLNNKISKIILSAKVFSTYENSKSYLTKPYTLLYFLIAIFVSTNYFLINNIIYKINNYLTLGRALGIKDLVIYKNLNIGFFLIIFMSFLICYIIYFSFLSGEKNNLLVFDKNLYIYLSICLLYYLFFLFNFNIQLYLFFKKKL
jgi:chaperonin cofactor prefoldin